MEKLTPMMQQYIELKEKHKDCILFFRLGDFYEMFLDDAILASQELEITLTARGCGMAEKAPMCGVPHHSAEGYIAKLIQKGYKVAICEQVEDPATCKGIVKRDVVRIITPGTVINASMLEEKENNYLAAIFMTASGAGLSYVDITTGEMVTAEFKETAYENLVINEIMKINPKEIVINDIEPSNDFIKKLEKSASIFTNYMDAWHFDHKTSLDTIKKHFDIKYISGLGLDNHVYATSSTGALLGYLEETQKSSLDQIKNLRFYKHSNHMSLDQSTLKHLELSETIREKTTKGSLLWILDKTSTAMGGRKIKKWIKEPLIDKIEIQKRLESVEALVENKFSKETIKDALKKIYDLERLSSKIAYGNANARDLIALKSSLEKVPEIKSLLSEFKSDLLEDMNTSIDPVDAVIQLIEDAISEDAPLTIKEGGIIKTDFNFQLKDFRTTISEGKKWIANLESTEKERTGIKSLKVGFNKVFGYYIEVTKSYYDLVPGEYIRKQTLANAERHITPELKEVEAKILNAESKLNQIEYDVFIEVRNQVKAYIETIQKTAEALSSLDVLISFSDVSEKNNYVRPLLKEGKDINIVKGRHPVIEQTIENNMFIPNDIDIDNHSDSFLLITGPNMAGKSTYMRQVAIIVLMAQIGCFVPAEKAEISIVDKIFTRIGASDNLAQGQSTFLVEMSELAYILNNATENSLIVLDEIGRGTSTYDGLSIAWAVVEYLCSLNRKIKTLFATHYHELTQLESKIKGFKNLNVLVKENADDVIFMHKIDAGSANRSYGIQVAKLAGVPDEIIKTAKTKLYELEEQNKGVRLNDAFPIKETQQMSMFDLKNNEVTDKLLAMDIVNMTPLEAFTELQKLITIVKE